MTPPNRSRGRPWTSVHRLSKLFLSYLWQGQLSSEQRASRKLEESACPVPPSMRRFLKFWGTGKVLSDKYNQTWRESKLFVLTQLHSHLYSAYPSISLSLNSYTVKPEKQTINCKGHFIAQLADQCTPIMGVLFASGVLPVSFQGPCLSILCGARHSCYVYCFLNRLVHYDALHRTLYECVFQ